MKDQIPNTFTIFVWISVADKPSKTKNFITARYSVFSIVTILDTSTSDSCKQRIVKIDFLLIQDRWNYNSVFVWFL